MKIIRWLVPLLLILVFFGMLTACSGAPDATESIRNQGYTCTVTFQFNGGLANSSPEQIYYVKPNSLLVEPGSVANSGAAAPTLAGYHVSGYYIKVENADGTTSEVDWNFATDRVSGDLTLYCRWALDYTLTVCYGENNSLSKVINTFSAETPSVDEFKTTWAGNTFLGYYYDKEYTEPVSFPYTHKLNADSPNEVIYAKFISGNYTFVSEPADMKSFYPGTNFYLLCDIDLTGTEIELPENYSGTIMGNGFTIKGLKLNVEQKVSRGGTENYGLFGVFSGKLKDLTIEDLTVNVKLNAQGNGMIFVGLFAGTCSGKAVLEDVTIKGTLTYTDLGAEATAFVAGELFGDTEDGAVMTNVTTDITVLTTGKTNSD